MDSEKRLAPAAFLVVENDLVRSEQLVLERNRPPFGESLELWWQKNRPKSRTTGLGGMPGAI
jgi:hypothetical protein